MEVLQPPLLLLLVAVLSPSAVLTDSSSKLVRIEFLTREVPIVNDKIFVVRCSPDPSLAGQVDEIYFSWGEQRIRNTNDSQRIDLGNGTLLFTDVAYDYNKLLCYVQLRNSTNLMNSKIFVPLFPLTYAFSGTNQRYLPSFKFDRDLKPGFETKLSCYGHCSCQFEQKWYIRVDDQAEKELVLDLDVRELVASLWLKSGPNMTYNLLFHSSPHSKNALFLVPAGAKIQVLCRLRAFTDGDALDRHPVLKFSADAAVGIFNMLLAAPPVPVTTRPRLIERCDPLESVLKDTHGSCLPHLQQLLKANGTMVSADRLRNASVVLPPAAARSLGPDNSHLVHCAALAQALLCSSALCSNQPCRQHCLLVRDHVCHGEVKLLRRFPDCDRFPDEEFEPACRDRFSLEDVMLRHSRPPSGALESDASVKPRTCFSRRDFWRGLFYQQPSLEQSQSSSCANWSSASNRLLSATYFASLRNAGNQCRNPGAQFHRPSCVDRSDPRFFVTCQVADCADELGLPPVSSAGLSEPIKTAAIVVALAALIALCGCVTLVVVLRRRCQKKNNAKEPGEETVSLAQSHQVLAGEGAPDRLVQRNVKFGQKTHLAKTYPKLERLAYSHDDFSDLGKLIGNGAFFSVHLVETTKYKEARPDMPKRVALKVLDETADDQIVESFFSEAELLLGMEHRYIMQVFGICASTRPFCLLVEYCEFGDLQTLLRRTASGDLGHQRRSHLVPNGSSYNSTVATNVEAVELMPSTSAMGASPPTTAVADTSAADDSAVELRTRPLELEDLLRMGSQVANALSYISKRGLVFRDLASRNILVTADYDIRLADFGMCRKLPLGNRAACVVSESECLPVRWLAPETVRESRFYPESDVYAFGVLLWELFSMGEQPWTGYSVEQVWEMKLQNADCQLPRPQRAPENVWALMRACWSADRAARPGFSSLTYQLHQAATHC